MFTRPLQIVLIMSIDCHLLQRQLCFHPLELMHCALVQYMIDYKGEISSPFVFLTGTPHQLRKEFVGDQKILLSLFISAQFYI